MNPNIESLVILGGGTAGWMVAAALGKVLSTRNCTITLVESDTIGTVGVGEATIPQLAAFNAILGIDENEFLKATQGTFKLGIEFADWGAKGECYMHPFGGFGRDFNNLQFYHHWQKVFSAGLCADLPEFSLNTQAAYSHKFMRPTPIDNSPLAGIAYAFHFDASLYAKFLRKFAEAQGVKRIENRVEDVRLEADTGNISALVLQDGTELSADFFIDCSGFRGRLIEGALHSGFEDWSEYLPCDSALAVASSKLDPLPPYTRSTAKSGGWQWRIPLQHRTGNGYVYASHFLSDAAAQESLLADIQGKVLAEPKQLRFTAGRRRHMWKNNCVAMGLAGGFLEPLESTSIHLVQSAISKFIALFPTKGDNRAEARKFNQQLDEEYYGIRDFIIAHYKLTRREDSEFWRYCKNMSVPQSLQEKVELYQSSSRLYRDQGDLFGEISWLAVLHGQGIKAKGFNPIANSVALPELSQRLLHIQKVIAHCVDRIPSHAEFIAKHCQADPH